MAGTVRDGTLSATPGAARHSPDGPRHAARSHPRSWPYILGLLVLDGAVTGWVWPTLTRPLWYDEAWRAYHLSIGAGWFSALRSANAPLPLGWYALERGMIATFGNTAFVLRLPDILALPVTTLLTYALARWWLGRPAAAIIAAAVTVNGSLIVYGMQLKSYLPEAACAAAVVLLWLRARRAAEDGRSPLPAQAGLLICGITSLSALLLLAPLLLIDLGAALAVLRPAGRGAGRRTTPWRRDPAARRLPGAVAVGVAALAHLTFFVLPQSYLTKTPYWAGFFLHRATGWHQLRTAGADLASRSLTDALLRPDGQYGSPFVGSKLLTPSAGWVVLALTIGLVVAWSAGLVGAARSRDGRALVAAILGAIALVVVGGALKQWPAGWVRANLFLLPPLYVLAGVGARSLVRAARAPGGAVGTLLGVVVTVAALGFAGLAVTVGIGRVDEVRTTAHDPLLLGDLSQLVAVQKAQAHPGDVQIVVSWRKDLEQWYKPQQYYAFYADETRAGTAVTNNDTLLLPPGGAFGDPIKAFLAARPHAGAVFLVTYNLVPDQARDNLLTFLRGQGWCPAPGAASSPPPWLLTGQLNRLTRCAG